MSFEIAESMFPLAIFKGLAIPVYRIARIEGDEDMDTKVVCEDGAVIIVHDTFEAATEIWQKAMKPPRRPPRELREPREPFFYER